MSSQELQILITMKDEFSKKLDKIVADIDSTAQASKKSSKSVDVLTMAVGGLTAVYGSLGFAMSAIQEYATDEQMYIRLATLTKNSTNATNEQIEGLREQAEALEQVGVVSAGNIITLQGQLATYDLTTESISRLTPALLDMAVAERGVNVTQGDMISFAEGISKALQGNFESLEKRGFILDDNTKKILENGTETERVTEINKVLNSTYKDANTILAKSSSGSMAQYQNKLNAIKSEIGGNLMPTLAYLQDSFINLITINDGASESMDFYGSVIYKIAQFGVTSLNTVKTAVSGIVALFDIGFTTVVKGLDAGTEKMNSWGETSKRNIDATKNSFNEWVSLTRDRKKFDISSIVGGGGSGASSDGASKKQLDDIKKLKEALKDLQKEYGDFKEGVKDDLFSLAEAHTKSMAGYREEISRLQKSLNELGDQYAKQNKSDRVSMAEQIVSAEKDIFDLQAKQKEAIHRDERAEIQKQIDAQQMAMLENKSFIDSFEGEVAEVKRRAGLTDLQRAIEDFNAKRTLATNEYNARVAEIQNDIKLTKKKMADESTLYVEKTNFIVAQEELARQHHAMTMDANVLKTKESVDKEIEYYRNLARAMSLVRGSNTLSQFNQAFGKVTNVNDAIISPKGDVISTHPDDYLIATKNPSSLAGGSQIVITGNTFMGDEDVAEKIGNMIINKLGLSKTI